MQQFIDAGIADMSAAGIMVVIGNVQFRTEQMISVGNNAVLRIEYITALGGDFQIHSQTILMTDNQIGCGRNRQGDSLLISGGQRCAV
ncbi:hypothetical protein SDC9_156761 [bioreactor metagenome]|uniref:Uncharacterized protein n=1 Tax=bioreactor metagenome TaxID=1076179 RepID=A0A645F5C7_9ZZZZ